MIYLMDDCEGGETLLLDPNHERNPPLAFAPTKGRALIFEHGVFHSGNRLKSGEKRAVRLDVLYTEDPQDAIANAGKGAGYRKKRDGRNRQKRKAKPKAKPKSDFERYGRQTRI